MLCHFIIRRVEPEVLNSRSLVYKFATDQCDESFRLLRPFEFSVL